MVHVHHLFITHLFLINKNCRKNLLENTFICLYINIYSQDYKRIHLNDVRNAMTIPTKIMAAGDGHCLMMSSQVDMLGLGELKDGS